MTTQRQRTAEHEAARSDPWRWYCRICGAEGQSTSQLVRNEQAIAHLDSTRCGQGAMNGRAEAGRLLHVWRY